METCVSVIYVKNIQFVLLLDWKLLLNIIYIKKIILKDYL